MFEKSLYDLIRGLRNHKGNERTYIQNSLKECRTEIKSQDMDVKATALLKLIYLEMFGHDMSWASFHVLEVMSSQKYLQKRVGYLGAQQSFGPNTDVLMLATNLLKKDLTSSLPTTISLPLITIPHIITPSLALSLLSDLLPRLTHSHPTIRKKTIVTLYRLALVYPETLRPAWPKIKERLMDENEEMTVTVTIVNVVCELAWRRPQDFLPLAPRLFSLLVDAGNNWMAIKIIKLFATLTPLEPRLVRKLLPPLTSLIKTTPAMSLLYECVNGIIQGGILESSEGTNEGEEIASLCVGKLRGMILTEGDRNLKYVALLAFNKIVTSHAHLVAEHQDVILDCIDDADISIRLRALDLVVSMVDGDSLMAVVERLMRQLRNSPIEATTSDEPVYDRSSDLGVVPMADSDDEDPEETLRRAEKKSSESPPLPDEYRIEVIRKVLDMCSRETYRNVLDFEWYLGVLVQLVRLAPAPSQGNAYSGLAHGTTLEGDHDPRDMSESIGQELLNVAVRVKVVRAAATRAAETLLLSGATGSSMRGALRPSVWIIGEYSAFLTRPDDTLTVLLLPSSSILPAETIMTYLQAIPKIFATLTRNDHAAWNPERKTMTSLLIARVIHFLEPLSAHPSLEIQERSVEFLELMRLVAESVSGQATSAGDGEVPSVPLMLTQVVPSLFAGPELNPVAPGAQRKVPLPAELDLDQPINKDLQTLLQVTDLDSVDDAEDAEFHQFYYVRDTHRGSVTPEPAANRLHVPSLSTTSSYQADENLPQDPEVVAKRLAERRERNKDDPFYIGGEGVGTGGSTPIHNILKDSNGVELDMDSIPIMNLDLGGKGGSSGNETSPHQARTLPPKKRKKVAIMGDETVSFPEDAAAEHASEGVVPGSNGILVSRAKAAKSILQVDSSGLGKFSFTGDGEDDADALRDARRREEEEEEMAKAMREVERARLEMQRAADRIQAARGVPPEGTLVKKKKKKAKRVVAEDASVAQSGVAEEVPAADQGGVDEGVVVKKKKTNKVKKGTKKTKKTEGDEVDGHDTANATEGTTAAKG